MTDLCDPPLYPLVETFPPLHKAVFLAALHQSDCLPPVVCQSALVHLYTLDPPETEIEGIEMFAQPLDHSFNDLFNQYVNMDASLSDNNKDLPFCSDFEPYFSLDSFPSDCGDISPIVPTAKRHCQSPQSWGTGFWALPKDAASTAEQRTPPYSDTIHPAAITGVPRNLESASISNVSRAGLSTSPSTPPATPNRKVKSALATPKSVRPLGPNEHRGVQRKQSPSLKPKRSSQLQKPRMAFPEAWAQRYQNLQLQGSAERLPISPPPSDILVQHEQLSSESAAQLTASGGSRVADHLRRNVVAPTCQYDSNMFTTSPAIPLPSPSAGILARRQQRYFNHANTSAVTTSSPPSADEIFTSPHSSDLGSMSSWQSEGLGSSTLPFTPDLQSQDPHMWFSPMHARMGQRATPYNPMINSPMPQRPTPNLNHPNDLMHGGLMIQLDQPFDMSNANESSFASTTEHAQPQIQETRSYTQFASAPLGQRYVGAATALATPQPRARTRTPSLSPHSGTPPTDMPTPTKAGPAPKTPHRRTHSRKLSSQSNSAPKPVKPSASSGSPKSANKGVTVSFVNFTAQDSQKILTGVAPSGSSKTKARREQEARERRRKLSEAALNAVRQAGGDVEALEAVFC